MQREQNGDIETGRRVTTSEMDNSNIKEPPNSSFLLKEKGGSASNEEVSSLSYQRLDISTSRTPSSKPDLKLQIPPRSIEVSEFKVKLASITPTSSSKPAKTPGSGGSQSRLSFRYRVSSSQSVKQGTPEGDMAKSSSQHTPEAQTSLSSPYSLSRLLRTLSAIPSAFPLTPNTELREIPIAGTPASMTKPSSKGQIWRSLSVPANKIENLKRAGSSTSGITLLVKPLTPRRADDVSKFDNDVTNMETNHEGDNEDGEKITPEEAVCRICFDELHEGRPTFKMECSCKGELSLAHEECAFKWFSIKGNHTCEVCGKNVKNLPVTIMMVSNENSDTHQQPTRGRGYCRLWQDVPILVIISMLAYFCLFEQLLVPSMGSIALAISLPFAIVLGLLASITASTLAGKNLRWGYAIFQFGLVILFSHILYSVIRLQAVLSILLASLAAFGISIGLNALILEFASWNREQAIRQTGTETSSLEAM